MTASASACRRDPVVDFLPHRAELRDVFNAILYVNRTRIFWKYVPYESPGRPAGLGKRRAIHGLDQVPSRRTHQVHSFGKIHT
ncbi:hypothetical protein E6P78_31725 [Streptomyces sp. A0958]|nr:hypothetical protein E6P78_31725 [Streptomyces sp. A0958]